MTVYYKMRYILFQNATAILLSKCDRNLLQNVSGFLLKNATVLLQNVTAFTKCVVYYKLQQHTLYLFI